MADFLVALARVITPENSTDVLPRFFYLSKQEAKAVEICPAAVVPRREVVTKVVTEVPRAPPFHLKRLLMHRRRLRRRNHERPSYPSPPISSAFT